MTEKNHAKFKPGDHKEFVVAFVARGDIRVWFGDRVADKLTNHDMKRIAAELAETYIGFHWYDELDEALSTSFDENPSKTDEKGTHFKTGDHKEFVVASVTRGDIRVLYGKQAADKLSQRDMEKVAKAMMDNYRKLYFYDYLSDVLRADFGVKC